MKISPKHPSEPGFTSNSKVILKICQCYGRLSSSTSCGRVRMLGFGGKHTANKRPSDRTVMALFKHDNVTVMRL